MESFSKITLGDIGSENTLKGKDNKSCTPNDFLKPIYNTELWEDRLI